MLFSRIESAATAAGASLVRVDSPAELPAELDLVLVDWSARRADWAAALRERSDAGLRIVLFGPHTDLPAHADAARRRARSDVGPLEAPRGSRRAARGRAHGCLDGRFPSAPNDLLIPTVERPPCGRPGVRFLVWLPVTAWPSAMSGSVRPVLTGIVRSTYVNKGSATPSPSTGRYSNLPIAHGRCVRARDFPCLFAQRSWGETSRARLPTREPLSRAMPFNGNVSPEPSGPVAT